MNTLNKKFLRLMIAGLSLGSTVCGGGYVGDGVCGRCGSLATGQLSIAGNAQLDGFFIAVHSFNGATGTVRASFDADIRALADVWGYGDADAEIDADFVDGLVSEIKGQIAANVEDGLQVNYVPAQCQANVNVAVEAQASCEASADCDVDVAPGQVSVACEGKCSGGCSGTCEGSASCAVKTPTVACEGTCEGTCELDAGGSCEGTCHGECDGECSLVNAEGGCEGECTGECTGACELKAEVFCEGTCHGTCYVDQGSAQCTAEAECAGSCDAECEGSCEGTFEPPSASVDCEASAECSGQARAQASAKLTCTPPQLDISFGFKAGVDVATQAEFIAKMTELRVRGAAILQGMAKLSALITGKVEGEIVFEPAPAAELFGQLNAVIDDGLSDELEISEMRLPCVIPAFKEAIAVMDGASSKFSGTMQNQLKIASIFKNEI